MTERFTDEPQSGVAEPITEVEVIIEDADFAYERVGYDDEIEQPAWTLARFLFLMLILIMLAAMVVWVFLPFIEGVANPGPLPTLNPPDLI